jgi:vacuolar-type H+-ATPase subunit D/Vma8
MLVRPRGAVALVAALAMVGIVPAAVGASPSSTSTSTSTSTSSSTTSTTTTTAPVLNLPPPPAPFTLPLDTGLQLLAQRNQANTDLHRFTVSLPRDRAHEKVAQRSWDALQRRLVRLVGRVHQTQHKLDVAHEDLQAAAVDAYMNAGSSRLETAIAVITSSNSAMEASRSMHLIGSFSDQQNELVHQYVALQKRLDRERKQVTRERDDADSQLAAAKARVVGDQRGVAHARVRLTASVLGIFAFQTAATSASSPILGPSLLTAQQLADYVRASGHQPRITVPLAELAQDYITEGANAGVRGDVAFAQSILETYWFTFPGGGQLAGRDNNFAGIGACDSCKHGFTFVDARTGVRAQMQALRIYVDPSLTDKSLKQPLVMPKMLNLGFRGKVQTWWDLWGTWATGAFYGQRVYDIYERMVAFAKTDPPH